MRPIRDEDVAYAECSASVKSSHLLRGDIPAIDRLCVTSFP